MDLFTPVVPPDQFHQNFARTLDARSAGVREVLTGWADGFVDRDGKFVKEFQTTYNSSFWELYLFAVSKHLGIKIDFGFDAPDFVAADRKLAVEAVIASHAAGDVPEWQKTGEGIANFDMDAIYIKSIIRLSNAFTAKSEAYTKRYKNLPHMAGRSYVVAISNYGTQDFNMLGDAAMQRLMFDPDDEGEVLKPNGSPVKVGCFNSDAFSHVSAVLYSAVATFGKARALGNDKGNFIFHATRFERDEIKRLVVPKAEYVESLTDGISLFVNPFASNPLDLEAFGDEDICKYLVDKDGAITVPGNKNGFLMMRMVEHMIEKK